tara:strand:- start:2579 stop:4393 length:1815 start_codon:yes stop_codon:yes gene_type:complete
MALSDIAMNAGKVDPSLQTDANIIEFVESSWGLKMKLFPVQRVILKAHYGLELDDTETFKISDWRREDFKEFTEKTYLEYLYDEGRCNIREVEPGHERREMILSIGRRSGKTMVSSCIAAYETYKLIKKENPQAYYGLPASNNIQIISVATDKDQAGLLYQEVSGHFRNTAFFHPYMANNTMSYARFQTPTDIDNYGSYQDDPNAKATLKITFRSCVAKGLRGAGNLVVILDEVAHFTDKGQSGAEAVYNAVTPSTSAFSPKDPNDSRIPTGPVEGRIILISSPLGRQGQFYKLFQIGMRGGKAAKNMLCVQAPTWEVNPTVPATEFEKHYVKDPNVFFTEYGGVFTDRSKGWIERASDLIDCVDPTLRPRTSAKSRAPHFIGIDLGLVGDGSAIAIGHINTENEIVIDLVDQIKAGEGDYANKERLEFDDVADWILALSKKFYLSEGLFDQWAGIPLEQALIKRGLRRLRSESMTKQKTSEMYKNFKDMLFDKRLKFYDYPIPEGEEHCGYISEILSLQATYHSKFVTTVEAPNADGKHDDMSDALCRMIWLASQQLGNQKYMVGHRKSNDSLSITRNRRKMRVKALRGGSHESRQVPKGKKR